jgi:hypothetical protein
MSMKIPYCIVCGRVGVDFGKVAGRDVAMCPDCARILLPKVQALVEAAAPKRPAKAVEKITPEKFKELIVKSVDERGSLNVFNAARARGIPIAKAREIAEEIAKEKGWELQTGKMKIILRKPAPPAPA